MVLDGLRGYIQLANGLTDVTRERARQAAKAMVAQGEGGVGAVVPAPVRSQVGSLTDDLLAAGRPTVTCCSTWCAPRSSGRSLGWAWSPRRSCRRHPAVASLGAPRRGAGAGAARREEVHREEVHREEVARRRSRRRRSPRRRRPRRRRPTRQDSADRRRAPRPRRPRPTSAPRPMRRAAETSTAEPSDDTEVDRGVTEAPHGERDPEPSRRGRAVDDDRRSTRTRWPRARRGRRGRCRPGRTAGPDADGDPRIAEAVARLQALGDSPPDEHVEVYEERAPGAAGRPDRRAARPTGPATRPAAAAQAARSSDPARPAGRRAGPPRPRPVARAGRRAGRRRAGAGPRTYRREAGHPGRRRREPIVVDEPAGVELRLPRRAQAGRRARRLRAARAHGRRPAGAGRRRVDRRLHRRAAAPGRRAGRLRRRRLRPAGLVAADRRPGHGPRPHQRPRPEPRQRSATPVDLVVADLSFISLRLVLPALVRCRRRRTPTWC